MGTILVLLGALIVVSLIIVFVYFRKKYPYERVLLYLTLCLFLYTFLLLAGLYALESKQPPVRLFNVDLYDALLAFMLWYYYVPGVFLILTLIVYLIKFIRKIAKRA